MTVTLEGGPGAGLSDWMAGQGKRIERVLDRRLPMTGDEPEGHQPHLLHEAMRYAVLGGGKRVRPLLVYAAGEVSGAAAEVLDGSACAVELIHAYSLVHDDLPCMDDDDLRRGKPTVHKKYGEAQAMLVGDALQALAFEALVTPLMTADGADRPRVPVAAMVSSLAVAAGAAGMAGGQALDLAAVGSRLTPQALQTMHSKKTGAMLAAAVRLGMLCGGAMSPPAAAAAADYGKCVGLAFQIVDDILDVTGDSTTLGKTAGKDQAQGKPTYVSTLGIDASRELARQLQQRAHVALAPFGARGSRLRALADFIVDRLN
jgi:farnesyl diphosphate synthase